MSQSIGTILTKVPARNSKPDELPFTISDQSNQVNIIKTERDLDSNLFALKQHQNARMADIARQQEKILTAASNRTVAEQRGKKAGKVLKLKQISDLQQSQKVLNARMKALRMEQERAGFIASLPPPAKDPLKTLLEKYDNGRNNFREPRTFFKNITKETDLGLNDARVEAIRVQEKENCAKEKLRELEDFNDQSNVRFSKAIKKEKLINSEKEVMRELEKVYKSDRIKQQKRIDTNQLIALPVTSYHENKTDVLKERNAAKAVKQVLMDSNVNVMDVDSSFITRRRKKKHSELDSNVFSLPFDDDINIYSPLTLVKGTEIRDETDMKSYSDKDSAIFSGCMTLNGFNISLEYAQDKISQTEFEQNEPEKAVVNTQTQTDIPAIEVSENVNSSPVSFFSLPNEISCNRLLSNNYAERYKKHLLHRAKQETFFEPLSELDSPLASAIPSTPSIPSTVETTHLLTLCSDVSSTPNSTQNEAKSTSTDSSSKLSAQIHKVLQKYIEKESLEQNERADQNKLTFKKHLALEERNDDFSKINLKLQMPPKFFSDCIRPDRNACEVTVKAPMRHRIFPTTTSQTDDATQNVRLLSKTKNPDLDIFTSNPKNEVSKLLTPIIEVTSPNGTENALSNLESDISSSFSGGSCKSLSDSKTKHLSQTPNADLKIPSYIQHKFLTDKMKFGFMDEPIETIDDLKELLACLPSGMKLEECLRTKPPVSYPIWIATETQPHELSTIPEVDTPQTSLNYSAESQMILPKASGFFTHLSFGDTSKTTESSKHSTSTVATKLGSAIKSQPSTASSITSYDSDQPKWADLLKLNKKSLSDPSISSLSPGSVQAIDPIRVNSQSTPVKNFNQTEDEFDLLSESITLIGPEITVSNRRTLTHVPQEKSVMSESLLSFLKHEEEANLHP